MASFRPPSSSQGGRDQGQPPFTGTTDSSFDYDDGRPTTSAGGANAQWTYADSSRPNTSRAGPPGTGSDYYPNGQQDFIEEGDEDYESEDEDVFTYLPPNTTQQQQLQQLQNAQAARFQQRSQQNTQGSDQAPFAFSIPGGTDTPSAPATSAYGLPTATTSSTPYSPASPVTPGSAVPLQNLSSYYGNGGRHPLVTTQSVVSSPPDTTSTAPPFAYDVPPSTGASEHYQESYRMTPLNSARPTSTSMSVPGTHGATNRNSREVHVSLPSTGLGSSDYGMSSFAPDGVGATSSTLGSQNARNRSMGEDEMGLRYRPDSKRTRGTNSTDSVELRHGAESVKTDISLSNPPYTPTLPSTAGGGGHHVHNAMYMDEDAEDSPFPEVRASVSNTDDPDMPALTFRTWFVGLTLCMVGAGVNMFFNFRYPAPYVSPVLLLLLAYPFGKLLAFILPIYSWTLPARLPFIGGSEFSFNPGPFNIKEHVLVFIMANVSINPAYAMNVIVSSELRYGYNLGIAFTFMLVLGTQMTGFALAGMCRRFLVWPASLIWPANLVTCTLLNTLHAEDDDTEGGGITRYKFFLYAFFGAFLWYFLPGFLFVSLSYFSFVCWIRPNNVVVNQLFGTVTGLGMGLISFDWAQISYIGSPLMVPWWAEVHIFIGFVLFYWILTPILYYNDVFKMAHFPISGNGPFDRFAKHYNVSRVLGPNLRLDQAAYDAYSPLYLPATYVITYFLAFMLATAVLVHTALYHGKALLRGFKRVPTEDDDIHAKLMRNYPEVPDWWYLTSFVIFFVFTIIAVQIRSTDTPVWALLLAVLIPIVYIIPSSYIYAMTGQPVGVNLIAEIVPGTLLAGKPLANMIFKCYSVQTMQVALAFTQDLKLGHYMKVNPRYTFIAQAVATLLAAITQIGVKQWMFANIPDLCTPAQKNSLTCPANSVFFSASAIWGLIGPQRQFGNGSIYHLELYGLVIGALLPLPFWWWQRTYPKSLLKYVNIPVLLNGPTFIPPATGINFSSWFAVGVVFQYFIRTRSFRWWSKFNYILSASLDSGTIVSIIFIFFTLQFPKNGALSDKVSWWGNTAWTSTADYKGIPFLSTPPEGF